MQVAELLRTKGSKVATVSSTASVGDAIASLRQHNIGALVVSDDGSAIHGIVSERDIVRALDGPEGALRDRLVGELMTADVHTCTPTDHLDDLMALMTESRIRHLPVVVDGVLRGIVSIGDVVKHRVSELETEAQVLTEYIQQGR